jgi:nucleoid-associated protein YgaU
LILSDAATAFADSQQSAPTLAAAEAPAAPMAPEARAAPEAPIAPAAPEPRATAKAPAAAETAAATACLRSGDGYFRARVAGAVEATIDWPNSGTRCEGEPRDKPPGVRLSFQRASGGPTDLLFVFGITGVREGQPLHEAGANLTVIVQGTNRIFGTLGDSRCTVDSLTQRALEAPGSYRLEARGFCTQPAHAVRGDGAVLVSTFEFAGLVTYDTQKN